MGQDLHELQEIHSVVPALFEKGVHYSLTERIYRQFWDSEEILSTECSTITAIQTRETAVQPFDLVRCKTGGILYLRYFILTQEQTRSVTHFLQW